MPEPPVVDVSRLWGQGSFGGRRNADKLAAATGGGEDTEQAVDGALEWLATHQMPDGGWSFDLGDCPSCQGRCSRSGVARKRDRAAATALAVLPFLGRGYTHREGAYEKLVDGGIRFLAQQVTQGQGKAYGDAGSLYTQGLVGIALAECYALTKDRRLFPPTRQAISFIMQAQDPLGGGWRYTPRQPGDTSASGWQIAALRSGYEAGIRIDPGTARKAVAFLDSVQQDGGAAYGYTGPGKSPGTSAVGLLCRMYLGWKPTEPALRAGAARLAEQGPSKDLYFDYYTTLVLRNLGGDEWAKWNESMKPMLLKTQATVGHETGSWCVGVDGGHGAEVGGRLYCTSLATLILEAYYRYRPISDSKE